MPAHNPSTNSSSDRSSRPADQDVIGEYVAQLGIDQWEPLNPAEGAQVRRLLAPTAHTQSDVA